MSEEQKKIQKKIRRKKRSKRKIFGTTERPRLCVYRSLKHVYAQIIDDTSGKSLVFTSSLSAEVRQKRAGLKGKCAVGKEVGILLAEKAKQAKITKIVFDRAGFLYHGRVKAVADGAREGGLEF